ADRRRDAMKAHGLADDSRFASGCRRMDADYWRTLLDVTNAVVTKRNLGHLRAAIAPNVRRIVPHDHTNLYVIDNQRRLQSFVIDPTALAWPAHLSASQPAGSAGKHRSEEHT